MAEITAETATTEWSRNSGSGSRTSSWRTIQAAPRVGRGARTDWQRQWSATLFDAGLAGPGWPAEWGGMALDLERQIVYYEEIARARVPGQPGNGPTIAGPTIIKYGTREQREKYLRSMLRGDQVWAQGFSEPGAGSDLPALRTVARREGDVYVVLRRPGAATPTSPT